MANPGFVLPEAHIEGPVQAILDSPVLPHALRDSGSADGREAAEVVADFVRRAALVGDLESGARTRAEVLQAIAGDDRLYLKEFSRAFVLMHFFYYLRRNPDDPPDTGSGGLDYWTAYLDSSSDFCSMEGLFRGSREYKSR